MSVFILKDPETLVALEPTEFPSEDDFQQLPLTTLWRPEP
jgi:hypothetical protein